MATAVSGLLTAVQATPNDLVGEWQPHIFVRNARGMGSGSMLCGLMAKLENEDAAAQEFNWFERDPVRTEVYSNAAFLSTDTTLTFDDGSGTAVWPLLLGGNVLMNTRTGEYVLITADPTSASVTVSRAFSGSAAAVVDNDPWVIVTLAKQDGALAVRASYEQPVTLTNYIQTFNSAVNLANAYKATTLRTDIRGPLDQHREQALEKIANQIEFAYFFGTKNRRTISGNAYQYFTGGITNAIDTSGSASNVLNGLGDTGVYMSVFKLWLRSFMLYGSDTKLAFCGADAYAVLSNYANAAANGFRIMNQETVFGMNITTILTPYGELSLVLHPLFIQTPSQAGTMVVVDLKHLKQKTMEPLFLQDNIQPPGSDSYQEQYRAKLGLSMKFINAFGYARNLKKILADY